MGNCHLALPSHLSGARGPSGAALNGYRLRKPLSSPNVTAVHRKPDLKEAGEMHALLTEPPPPSSPIQPATDRK